MTETETETTQSTLTTQSVLAVELSGSLSDLAGRWPELTQEQRRTMLLSCAEALCDLVADFGALCDREGVEPQPSEVAP